ncbi:gastric inhibitory polypeptide receptor [Magallana gigas]|uniref:gastric inhibitory polypeptide receptor n=1 Tax=Magallana gigas TaxID=29159 RepID=UPI003341315C
MEECNFLPYPTDGELYCNATFDVQCWNYTLAGTTARGACPENHQFSIFFDDPEGYSYRKCETNGQWYKPNYTPCVSPDSIKGYKSDSTHLPRITYIYISGYALSILLLIIALIIFGTFRQLWCKRVFIHSNLFSAYILNGFAWIAADTISKDYTRLSNALGFVGLYTLSGCYGWMLAEGIFLHFCLVNAFSNKKTLVIVCCIVGWVCPVISTGTYAVLMEEEGSIIKYWPKNMDYLWIILVPIILSQLLNIIFLINIIRILRSQVQREDNRNLLRYRKIVRAILILIPLLGLQNLTKAVTIDSVYFRYFAAVISSYQGAVVPVLFCFLNREVLSAMNKRITTWRRLSASLSRGSDKVSILFNMRRSSSNQSPSAEKLEPEPLL